MLTWYFIGGVVLFVACLALAGWSLYRAGRESGYEEGRADAYTECRGMMETRAPGWPGPRHAKSQPRASAPSPPAAVPPERTGWFETALLAPSPAPAVDGAEDTGTMGRVKLSTGDTGEMRAVTDDWIAG